MDKFRTESEERRIRERLKEKHHGKRKAEMQADYQEREKFFQAVTMGSFIWR